MSVRLSVLALDLPEGSIQRCRELLSEDERQRADRFRSSALTANFISARTALRLVLSKRLGCKAEDIEFCYGLHGKPKIGQPADARGLPFNLSHSGQYVVVAIGDEQPIGVDLEMLRPLKKGDSLARMVFSSQEMACWRELPTEQQTTSLFRVWTLKEACLKATGEGFSRPMPSFVVGSDSSALTEANQATVQFASGVRLEVKQVEAPAGYMLAVATENAERPLELEAGRQALSKLVQ